MKKITKMLLIVLSASVIMFTSCTKKGDTGAAGAPGNANVSSDIITISQSSWSGGSGVYTYVAVENALTNADKDAVMAYVYVNNEWFAMPATSTFKAGDILQFSYMSGSIKFIYLASSAPAGNTIFKVVVIPPAMKIKNVDYNNYEQVKMIYNLQD